MLSLFQQAARFVTGWNPVALRRQLAEEQTRRAQTELQYAELARAKARLVKTVSELETARDKDPKFDIMNGRAFDHRFDQMLIDAVRANKTAEKDGASHKRSDAYFLFIDLDDFKQINDKYGHDAGDCALRFVGQSLRHVMQRDEDIVARYGGDEFVVGGLVKNKGDARMLAEKMLAFFQETDCPYTLKTGEVVNLPVKMSIGAMQMDPAMALTGAHGVGTLRNLADEALYAAKKNGKGQVVDVSVSQTAVVQESVQKIIPISKGFTPVQSLDAPSVPPRLGRPNTGATAALAT